MALLVDEFVEHSGHFQIQCNNLARDLAATKSSRPSCVVVEKIEAIGTNFSPDALVVTLIGSKMKLDFVNHNVVSSSNSSFL